MTEILGSRYVIHEQIGEGGMADVHRGQDTTTGETVAIKVLKPHMLTSASDVIARFNREAELLRKLNHPNIINVLEVFNADGKYYIIMQYASGGTLYDLIRKEGHLSIDRAVAIALELADALVRAHHLRIIHRDIKPSNVLMAEDGTPMLSDFGVAHVEAFEQLTDTGVTVGTLDYLSPEALNGEPSDTRVDVWAFGILLYEMLTGQRPFTGENPTHLLHAILLNPLPKIRGINPDIPQPLATLIESTLQKDPSERISSMRKVGVELEEIKFGADFTPTTSRFKTPSRPTGVDYREAASRVSGLVRRKSTSRSLVGIAFIAAIVIVAGLIVANQVGLINFFVTPTPTITPTNTRLPPTLTATTVAHPDSGTPVNSIQRAVMANGRLQFSNSVFTVEVPRRWENILERIDYASTLGQILDNVISDSVIVLGGSPDLLASDLNRFMGVIIVSEELPDGVYTMDIVEARQLQQSAQFRVTIHDVSRIETPAGEMLRLEAELPEGIRPVGISRVSEHFLLDGNTLYWIMFFSRANDYSIILEERDNVLNSFELK